MAQSMRNPRLRVRLEVEYVDRDDQHWVESVCAMLRYTEVRGWLMDNYPWWVFCSYVLPDGRTGAMHYIT